MRRTAERVVSDYFGADISLRIEHLVPDRLFSVVTRLRTVAAPSHVPETVIVKAAAPDIPTAPEQVRTTGPPYSC